MCHGAKGTPNKSTGRQAGEKLSDPSASAREIAAIGCSRPILSTNLSEGIPFSSSRYVF
jgi:hypothetical protein